MPGHSPARDGAVLRVLPFVDADGWTAAALRRAGVPQAGLLFPGGSAEMVEAYVDLADRWMQEDAAAAGLGGLRLSQRVREVIALRLKRNEPFKPAVRRGLSVLASPANAGVALRSTAGTVDAIWAAVGDRSADFSWYTKRLTLAGLYGATLLRWLQDPDPDAADTLAFLDRGLAGLGRIGQARGRLQGRLRARFARG